MALWQLERWLLAWYQSQGMAKTVYWGTLPRVSVTKPSAFILELWSEEQTSGQAHIYLVVYGAALKEHRLYMSS